MTYTAAVNRTPVPVIPTDVSGIERPDTKGQLFSQARIPRNRPPVSPPVMENLRRINNAPLELPRAGAKPVVPELPKPLFDQLGGSQRTWRGVPAQSRLSDRAVGGALGVFMKSTFGVKLPDGSTRIQLPAAWTPPQRDYFASLVVMSALSAQQPGGGGVPQLKEDLAAIYSLVNQNPVQLTRIADSPGNVGVRPAEISTTLPPPSSGANRTPTAQELNQSIVNGSIGDSLASPSLKESRLAYGKAVDQISRLPAATEQDREVTIGNLKSQFIQNVGHRERLAQQGGVNEVFVKVSGELQQATPEWYAELLPLGREWLNARQDLGGLLAAKAMLEESGDDRTQTPPIFTSSLPVPMSANTTLVVDANNINTEIEKATTRLETAQTKWDTKLASLSAPGLPTTDQTITARSQGGNPPPLVAIPIGNSETTARAWLDNAFPHWSARPDDGANRFIVITPTPGGTQRRLGRLELDAGEFYFTPFPGTFEPGTTARRAPLPTRSTQTTQPPAFDPTTEPALDPSIPLLGPDDIVAAQQQGLAQRFGTVAPEGLLAPLSLDQPPFRASRRTEPVGPAFVFDADGNKLAKTGPFAGVRTVEQARARVQDMVGDGSLVMIASTLSNKVYERFDVRLDAGGHKVSRPTGQVVRVPSNFNVANVMSSRDFKLAVAAGRTGGPVVDVDQSLFFVKQTVRTTGPKIVDDFGVSVMVMEKINGTPLNDALAFGAEDPAKLARLLTPQQYVQLAADLTEALVHLNRNNIAHADFHGGNVILTPDRHLRVIDYGQATPLTNTRIGRFALREDLEMLFTLTAPMRPRAVGVAEWEARIEDFYLRRLNAPSPANTTRMNMALQLLNELRSSRPWDDGTSRPPVGTTPLQTSPTAEVLRRVRQGNSSPVPGGSTDVVPTLPGNGEDLSSTQSGKISTGSSRKQRPASEIVQESKASVARFADNPALQALSVNDVQSIGRAARSDRDSGASYTAGTRLLPSAGLLKGVTSVEGAATLIDRLVAARRLEKIDSGADFVAYRVLGDNAEPTGRVLRVPKKLSAPGKTKPTELQAAFSLARAGLAPQVYREESLVLPGADGRSIALLVMQELKGREFGDVIYRLPIDPKLPSSPNDTANRARLAADLLRAVAQFHGQGLVDGDRNDGNLRYAAPDNQVLMHLDFVYTKPYSNDTDAQQKLATDIDIMMTTARSLMPADVPPQEWLERVKNCYLGNLIASMRDPESQTNQLLMNQAVRELAKYEWKR
jgi:tRNA A-37 threonylcarbamoyl transferase component Bud32